MNVALSACSSSAYEDDQNSPDIDRILEVLLNTAEEGVPVFPEQFFPQRLMKNDRHKGGALLLWAVLEDAIGIAFRYRESKNTAGIDLFNEVREWFLSDEEEYICSFRVICWYFGLNPEYLRTMLWKRLGVATYKRLAS